MGNASGQRGEMSGSEKKSEQEFVRHFLHKPFTRKFLEVSRCSRAKQRQKQLCCTCRVDLLLNIDLLLFVHRSRCLRRLVLHDFIFCLNKL